MAAIAGSKNFNTRKRTRRNIFGDKEFLNRILDWNTFYRRNLHRFVEHYLRLDMHLYQIIMLYLMNLVPLVVIVAARASAKSYIIAIYACAKCILYPGTKIVIASATKAQAGLIVSEKIRKELIPNSPNLAREIKEIKTGLNQTEVIFHNGSSAIVCAANENARGLRATVIIYEEFRMIKKEIVDMVLSPFLIPRQVPYLNKNPEWLKKYPYLKEEPMEIYISSAYFASHWMSETIKMAVKDMFNKSEGIFLSFDYAITLKHGIRTRKQMEREKKKLGSIAFAMEYGNEMVGSADGAFYDFESLDKLQKLKKAFYPKEISEFTDKKNKLNIPKQAGEVRVVSVDISVMGGKENDNSAITCIRGLPSGDFYERQVPYQETYQGKTNTDQAIRIKQVFYDFQADYIVMDAAGVGIGVFEELGKINNDEARDIEYPAFTCFNDKDLASRIKNRNALPLIYTFKGQLESNQLMHFAMKDVIDRGRLKLLLNAMRAKDYLEEQGFYNKATIDEQVDYEAPYMETDLLINEMANLKKVIKQGKWLALEEPSTGTKDRYISLAMGNLFIKDYLEVRLSPDDDEGEDLSDLGYFVSGIEFKI